MYFIQIFSLPPSFILSKTLKKITEEKNKPEITFLPLHIKFLASVVSILLQGSENFKLLDVSMKYGATKTRNSKGQQLYTINKLG